MNLYPLSKRVCVRAAITLMVSVFVTIFAAWQFPTTHAATTFTVNSLADTPDAAPGNGACATATGDCTLRAAIEEANSLAGDDTINFSITGTINLTGALPVLSSNITINGPGSSLLTVRRDTGGNYRILQTSATSSISGLTITNGRTPDGVSEDVAPSGGGIWQTGGSLTLRDVVITGNTTGNGSPTRPGSPNSGGFGGFGGGIYASGTLTMTDCVVSNNTTGGGGNGISSGGSGGRGAGIYFAPGTLTLTRVTISGNRTGDGGGPGGNGGDAGGMWTGGDFFPSQATNVILNKVIVNNNSTGNASNTGNNGGGWGGGIYSYQATMSLTDSTVSNNHTGNYTPGSFAGVAGSGGGIFNSGTLTITRSLISGNTTGDSSNNANSTGGGISNSAILTLINSTVSGNSTGGGPSMGGGIFSGVNATLINCTITKNIATSGFGNGVTGHQGTYTVANTIIAGNGPSGNGPDLLNAIFTPPTYDSLGHNLIGNAEGFSASFNKSGDQIGDTVAPLDPHLGPLADNGGPTLTHALLTNSTALDAGDDSLAQDRTDDPLETDQRGVQRFADSPDADSIATVDIGAFEFLESLEDISDHTTNEDTPLTISFGVGDNGAAVSSVTASSNNQALIPNGNLAVSGTGNVRSLQITPAANQSGIATITVTANLSGGGTLTDTFVLTVNSVNDQPTFSLSSAPAVLEDSGAQTVANFATNINAGPDEGAQTLSFTVTNNTNPSLFSVAPAVSSSGTLTYTPAPNAFGDAVVSIVLKDNGGTANGGVDTSTEQSFTISITPVNDAPSFTKGANQTVNEDAGFQSILNWATGISAGPNESSQSLTFVVTNNTNPALFSSAPAINSFGTLSYIPAANANGTADITIVLKDNGGTANGGVDTSASQTFTITVNAVNDAPVTNAPFFVTTNQNTPLVLSGLNVISVSDVDAGSDPVRVSLTATQGTLTLSSTAGLTFTTGDGVDDSTIVFTGTITNINASLNGLTYTPSNGFSGVASLQIVADDQGHNGSGGAKTATSNVTIQVLSGGTLNFNTANYGVNESGGTATITVVRAGGNAGTATVNYSTSNGTATAGATCSSGVDYIPTSGTFTWNNGDASVRQFTITICNDGTNEDDDTINLTLSNAGGTGSLGTQSTATLTVGNDDAPVLLTEELTSHAIALDLVNLTRDPFSLTSVFNMSGNDQRRRVSLFVWKLGLLPSDTPASVTVVARDDEGRTYDLPVEALTPAAVVGDVTQRPERPVLEGNPPRPEQQRSIHSDRRSITISHAKAQSRKRKTLSLPEVLLCGFAPCVRMIYLLLTALPFFR
jgi:CSLREA domain-containing protein